MSDFQNWWASRIGQYQAATLTAVRPQGDPGAAISLATAPMNTAQHSALVNDIVTVRDEEVEQEEQKSFLEGVLGAFGNNAVTSLATDLATGFVSSNPEMAKSVADTGSTVAGAAGLYAERSGVTPAMRKAGEGLDWFDKNVYRPAMRGISTPVQAFNIGAEEGGRWTGWGELLEGETWSDAWDRAEHTTFGQGIFEGLNYDPDERAEFHSQGFDEFGNPVNQAYADIRRNDAAYNIVSGTLDFATTWYAAPEVLAAKTVTKARALTKGDLDRLSPHSQARVRHIATVPEARLGELKQSIPAWDVVGRRAIRLREQTLDLRNQVRAGDLTPNDLAETVMPHRGRPLHSHLPSPLRHARSTCRPAN
jgi:hypothetical protein